jgi:hypothetical protein
MIGDGHRLIGGIAEFPQDSAERSAMPAMAVENSQCLEAHIEERPADVDDHAHQHPAAKNDRARPLAHDL